MATTIEGQAGAKESIAETLVKQLLPDLQRSFDPDVEDGVALVLAPRDSKRAELRYISRDTAAEVLLDLGERAVDPALKQLAARLLGRPRARRGSFLCALAGRGLAAIHEVPEPEDQSTRIAIARVAIASECLARRGLTTPAAAERTSWAVRSRSCNLCTTWAMALDELGIDVEENTAPDADRVPSQPVGSSSLCATCLKEQRAIVALAREEHGLGPRQAINAMMPRAVLAHLESLRARDL